MEFRFIDYAGQSMFVAFDLDDVKRIEIKVVSGDEIVTIKKQNGDTDIYDLAGAYRIRDYFDYSYVVFDRDLGINIMDESWFSNRCDSYAVINNYPITKEYILDYDLSEGTDGYIHYDVLGMLIKESEKKN